MLHLVVSKNTTEHFPQDFALFGEVPPGFLVSQQSCLTVFTNDQSIQRKQHPTIKNWGGSKNAVGLPCCPGNWGPWMCARHHVISRLPRSNNNHPVSKKNLSLLKVVGLIEGQQPQTHIKSTQEWFKKSCLSAQGPVSQKHLKVKFIARTFVGASLKSLSSFPKPSLLTLHLKHS